jgi:hypothetical protein
MSTPGPETQVLCSRYFARFGQWPSFLILILGSDPIPPDLEAAAYRLRKVWLRVEAEKELRDELNPLVRKTVTWTTETGETVTFHGYEPRAYETKEVQAPNETDPDEAGEP